MGVTVLPHRLGRTLSLFFANLYGDELALQLHQIDWPLQSSAGAGAARDPGSPRANGVSQSFRH